MNCERSGSELGRSFTIFPLSLLLVVSGSGVLATSVVSGRPAKASGAESLYSIFSTAL